MGNRALNRLSALQAKRLAAAGRHADGGGLYLQINKAGNKSWVFRYTHTGHTREMGLGSFQAVSLELARDLAAGKRAQVAQDQDPIAERRQKRLAEALAAASAVTFKQAALEYIDRKKAGWRSDKHAQQWQNTLEAYAYPVFGNLPVQNVDTNHVMRALDPIWLEKNETATRVRERIEAVLDAAKARGYRLGENPARWRGHLENLLAKPKNVNKSQHHPALPFHKVGEFMAALRKQEGLGARALELTILTACRTNEVLGAQWQEIDLDRKIWIVPADRMKGGKEHRVPLSSPCCALLQNLRFPQVSTYIFPGQRIGKPLSSMAMIQVLNRMGRRDITVHGFRSTFRDWAAELTSAPREVAEMALAHSIGSAVEAAYRRGDLFEKRAKLMAAWAFYCANQVNAHIIVLKRGATPRTHSI